MRQNTRENEVTSTKKWKLNWDKCQEEWNIQWNSCQTGMKQNPRENEVAAMKDWKFNGNKYQEERNISWNSFQMGMRQNSRENEVAAMKKWKFNWNKCQKEWNIEWRTCCRWMKWYFKSPKRGMRQERSQMRMQGRPKVWVLMKMLRWWTSTRLKLKLLLLEWQIPLK